MKNYISGDYIMRENFNENMGKNNKKISPVGIALCILAGLLITALLFWGVDLKHVPILVLIFIWGTISTVIILIVKTFKE